jgi:putative endonuclease
MTNFAHGRAAEAAAAAFLEAQGYTILAQNWRTPVCEIDIVAEKRRRFRLGTHRTVLLVEVKYRQRDKQGGGLEYITPKKLEQMAFAAEVWVQEQRYDGDYALAAVEVSGLDYRVTGFLDNLT